MKIIKGSNFNLRTQNLSELCSPQLKSLLRTLRNDDTFGPREGANRHGEISQIVRSSYEQWKTHYPSRNAIHPFRGGHCRHHASLTKNLPTRDLHYICYLKSHPYHPTTSQLPILHRVFVVVTCTQPESINQSVKLKSLVADFFVQTSCLEGISEGAIQHQTLCEFNLPLQRSSESSHLKLGNLLRFRSRAHQDSVSAVSVNFPASFLHVMK